MFGAAVVTGICWKGTRKMFRKETTEIFTGFHRLWTKYYFVLHTGQNFTRTRTEQLLGDSELNNNSGDNMVLGKTGISIIYSGENLLNILGI